MANCENDFPDFSVSVNIVPYQFEPLLMNNNEEGSDDTYSCSSNDEDILPSEEGRLGNTHMKSINFFNFELLYILNDI